MKIFQKLLVSSTIILFIFISSCATMNFNLTKTYNIYVEQLKNETVYYNLNSDLTELLTQEFLRDTNIQITKKKLADIKITGTITRYEKSPLSYDANNAVESYEMLIFVKLRLLNASDDDILWEKQNIVGDTIYRTIEGGNTTHTNNVQAEEAAQTEILNYLSQDISRMIITALVKIEQEETATTITEQ